MMTFASGSSPSFLFGSHSLPECLPELLVFAVCYHRHWHHRRLDSLCYHLHRVRNGGGLIFRGAAGGNCYFSSNSVPFPTRRPKTLRCGDPAGGGKCKVCVSRFFPIPNWISAIEKEGKSHNYFGEPAPIFNRGIAPYFHAVPLMAGRGTHAVARTPAISLQS